MLALKNSKSTYLPVTSWIDGFGNFREAVYIEDVAKMKTYFNFSVFAEITQIWEAVYENIGESKRPQTIPSTFIGKDLEKNYKQVFNEAFVKSLLKVKTQQLYDHGEFTTPKTVDKDRSFYMLANYDKATSSLQLSLMF